MQSVVLERSLMCRWSAECSLCGRCLQHTLHGHQGHGPTFLSGAPITVLRACALLSRGAECCPAVPPQEGWQHVADTTTTGVCTAVQPASHHNR